MYRSRHSVPLIIGDSRTLVQAHVMQIRMQTRVLQSRSIIPWLKLATRNDDGFDWLGSQPRRKGSVPSLCGACVQRSKTPFSPCTRSAGRTPGMRLFSLSSFRSICRVFDLINLSYAGSDDHMASRKGSLFPPHAMQQVDVHSMDREKSGFRASFQNITHATAAPS